MKHLFLLSSIGLLAAATEAPTANAKGGAPDKKPDADKKSEPEKKVTVEVLAAAVGEGDETFVKGQQFTTTPARAAALGDSVKVVS